MRQSQRGDARLLASSGLLVVLLMTFGASPALAGPTKKCNADAPVRRCPGDDGFTSYGRHVLRSGVNECAAIGWMSGWPAQTTSEDTDESHLDQLVDIEHHADVVAPEGITLPERGGQQATTEVQACWVLEPITGKKERPAKLKDARKPLEILCSNNPQGLRFFLPELANIGRVSLDAHAQQMTFFGVPLSLVPHPGSAYLGVTKAFAVTLQKRSGAYTIVLPDGRTLTGSCEIPPNAR